MVMLTSINGREFCLNSDLIYKVEEKPDTIITLVDGKKVRVQEKTDEIIERVIEYNKQIHTNLFGG